MVCRGVELKHIAAVFDLPLVFRKFGPYSAIDAARLIDTLAALPELVHSYMPASEKGKKRWLRAIRNASMAGPPFIRWAARHALDLGKTIDDVVFTLEDINDWVVASYASTIPDYVWIAIIQHDPPREQTYNARFITRPFHEDMSLNTVRQLSEEWHHAVAEAGPEGENYTFPPPWYPEGKVGNLEIVPIRTLADLYLEGKTMHHCATTYADQIKAGSSYMYGIKKGEERIATLELHISYDNDVEFGQLRGPCNARVQSDVTRAARRWFSQCKREHGMPKLRVISPPINDGWDDDIPF